MELLLIIAFIALFIMLAKAELGRFDVMKGHYDLQAKEAALQEILKRKASKK